MPERSLFLLYTEPLQRIGLEYMITGSVAGIIYGEPRLTHDVDLVLVLPRDKIAALLSAFEETEFYKPLIEVVRTELARTMRGHFNLIHHPTGYKADVYLASDDPLHAWGLAHRHEVELEGTTVWVAPPEYVILRKLEYYREGGSTKHLGDIRGILRGTATLDDDMIETMAADRGLLEVWREAKASSPAS